MKNAPLPQEADASQSRRRAGRTVLDWASTSLDPHSGVQQAGFHPEVEDWPMIVELLFAHRLAILALPALRAANVAVPDDVVAQIDRFIVLTSRMNAANLLSMREILPRFEAAGLEVAVFKGPVVQQLAYGNLFARPSSDIDLLVAPKDFARSRPIVEAAGYDLAAECRSIWWRAALGEQHYQGRTSAATTVDLHHRVQQPGCPLPKHMSSLIGERVAVQIAGQTVPTLSPVHGRLLTAMSFVKALHHREPAARYVIDFMAYAKRQPAGHWGPLLSEARRQGLANTVALTLRVCRLLFPGSDDLPEPSEPILEDVPDAVLWDMTLYAGLEGLPWPKRRKLLHGLYDRKYEYPLGFGIMAGSELLRHMASAPRAPGAL